MGKNEGRSQKVFPPWDLGPPLNFLLVMPPANNSQESAVSEREDQISQGKVATAFPHIFFTFFFAPFKMAVSSSTGISFFGSKPHSVRHNGLEYAPVDKGFCYEVENTHCSHVDN